jgi:hypothetical protein
LFEAVPLEQLICAMAPEPENAASSRKCRVRRFMVYLDKN